jgi:XTP/dITP diphosphohydrolase
MKFFIGTTNSDKIREIVSILNAVGCDFEITPPIDPEETEPDFEGNAILKACVYAKHVDGVTISEDSGLVIPSLHGLPGPWSARFSDCEIDINEFRVIKCEKSDLSRQERDQKNNQLVLELMKDIEQPRRAAMFKVVLVVADSAGKVLFKGVGESHGWISEEARGTNGFGYDPVFIGNDTFEKTYAELDPMRKNLRSHRNKVLNEFKAWLGQYLKQNELTNQS